jgi:formylglycine-generating enzyme required for sulfatase activity
LGFGSITGIDLERLAMEELVATFEEQARAADVAFVFYAGHGIQVAGRNYLVPIDASLQRESDVRRLIEADWVLESAGRARRLAVVFLDACRDNPLAATYAAASRSAAVGRGLASIGRAPPNMLVAYATAADGQGLHSPFTTALLEHLPTPDVELRLALGRVRDAVAQRTGQEQIPYTYGSLGGDEFYLVAPAQPEGPMPPTVQLLARPEGGAGPAFRDCPTCPELVPLAAGRFNLGSPGGEAGHEADEAPQRPIALAKSFAIGRFEITFAQWPPETARLAPRRSRHPTTWAAGPSWRAARARCAGPVTVRCRGREG